MLWGKARTYREGLKKSHLFTMKFLSGLWGLGRWSSIRFGLGQKSSRRKKQGLQKRGGREEERKRKRNHLF